MTFPVNVPAVTIWEKTVIDRAPAYVRHVTGAAYWQDCRGQNNGRDAEDNVFIAIPAMSVSYMPKKDDRILPGEVEGASPPGDALTVMQVKNFLYAAQMMQHVEVTAK